MTMGLAQIEVTLLFCHMISCDHTIKGGCDLVSGNPSLVPVNMMEVVICFYFVK